MKKIVLLAAMLATPSWVFASYTCEITTYKKTFFGTHRSGFSEKVVLEKENSAKTIEQAYLASTSWKSNKYVVYDYYVDAKTYCDESNQCGLVGQVYYYIMRMPGATIVANLNFQDTHQTMIRLTDKYFLKIECDYK